MSDQDQDSSQWQLGMSLPSRKETHGRKKKGDRKLDKQEKKERVRYVEAIPEDPRYAAPLEDVLPPAAEEQDAVQQLQAYWDEAAATATLTLEEEALATEVGVAEEEVPETGITHEEVSQQAGGLSEDDAYLRDLLAGTESGQDTSVQSTDHAVVADMSLSEIAAIEAASPNESTTTDPTLEEEDNAPVFAKWKIALLIIITPIVLLVVLAWGKLAYVHQVPTFVQQQVPAYQQGKGFLILKPWWFGPPIFTLDQYERTDGEDFTHWKIQLNDYTAVVDDPTVLYTFPDDILK